MSEQPWLDRYLLQGMEDTMTTEREIRAIVAAAARALAELMEQDAMTCAQFRDAHDRFKAMLDYGMKAMELQASLDATIARLRAHSANQ